MGIVSKNDYKFKVAYEHAVTRCQIVMSRPNWGLELTKRVSKILERNYNGYPQWIYDQEEKELIMIKLGLN